MKKANNNAVDVHADLSREMDVLLGRTAEEKQRPDLHLEKRLNDDRRQGQKDFSGVDKRQEYRRQADADHYQELHASQVSSQILFIAITFVCVLISLVFGAWLFNIYF